MPIFLSFSLTTLQSSWWLLYQLASSHMDTTAALSMRYLLLFVTSFHFPNESGDQYQDKCSDINNTCKDKKQGYPIYGLYIFIIMWIRFVLHTLTQKRREKGQCPRLLPGRAQFIYAEAILVPFSWSLKKVSLEHISTNNSSSNLPCYTERSQAVFGTARQLTIYQRNHLVWVVFSLLVTRTLSYNKPFS